jgi:hypothetical protein
MCLQRREELPDRSETSEILSLQVRICLAIYILQVIIGIDQHPPHKDILVYSVHRGVH